MCEFSKDDEENDETRNPGVHLVHVDNLVSEERDYECACRDDNDTCVSWYVGIDRIQKLGAYYDIDSGPSDACKDVEECDCSILLAYSQYREWPKQRNKNRVYLLTLTA